MNICMFKKVSSTKLPMLNARSLIYELKLHDEKESTDLTIKALKAVEPVKC
jgi:hypothetical protein